MSTLKEQYLELKNEIMQQVETPVLLIKLGDYYEAFFGDAVIVSRILQLPVDRRDGELHVSMKGGDAVKHLWKLERAGYKPVIVKENGEVIRIEKKPEDVVSDDYCEATIVEIYTDGGTRYVHYMGYGYYSVEDDDEVKPYRFTEYTWFIVPLRDVLKTGIYNYECENADQYKQYIEDCTEERCKEIYETYNNGEMPKLIFEDEVDMNTPDGFYILVRKDEEQNYG